MEIRHLYSLVMMILILCMICVADTMKEDSPQAIKEMQNMGIQVVMLTGDNKKTADAIGSKAGVDEVIVEYCLMVKRVLLKIYKSMVK